VHVALRAAAAVLAAFAAAGCGDPCAPGDGTLAALDYSSGECAATGLVVYVTLLGEAYDDVEVLVGPLPDGRIEVTSVRPKDGTVTVRLPAGIGWRALPIGVRGYRAVGAVAFGSARPVLQPGGVTQAFVTVEPCVAPDGPFCMSGQLVYPDGGRLMYCEGGVSHWIACEAVCEIAGDRCAPPPTGTPPACGAACGGCPDNCVCEGDVVWCE